MQNNFSINVEIENGLADEKLPTLIEELAYRDTWQDGLDSYLSMMRDRLVLLKRLLKPTGSIYVHCDWHAGHYLKVLMDEVFGYNNFRSEVAWKRTSSHNDPNKPGSIHDTIFFYTLSEEWTWQQQYQPLDKDYVEKVYVYEDQKGRYRLDNLTAPGISNGVTGQEWRGVNPTSFGRHWRRPPAELEEVLAAGGIQLKTNGKPSINGWKQYLDKSKGMPIQSIWQDLPNVTGISLEKLNFPTQKPLTLLQRIIAASSNPGDLVLDAFAGSGTTAEAAETMKDVHGKPAPRRWIAIDCGKFAIHITRKRLIEAQARPFAVENIGFYARAETWNALIAKRPSARVYRDALVEIYGGEVVDGFTFLHGRKAGRWIHVGPLDAPLSDEQVREIVHEAASTDIRAVDVLSADIPVDWNPTDAEYQYGVRVYAKIIPQAAVEAVQERLKRKRRKDPSIELAPDIHFFTPPDVEVAVVPHPGGAAVKLTRLTVDLDDCLSTQNAQKRAAIVAQLTDWRALIDYWAVDWDWREGEPFQNDWQSFRTRKQRNLAWEALHEYPDRGEKRIGVKVTDIFGNDGLKVVRITL